MTSDLAKIFMSGADAVMTTPGAYGLATALRAMAGAASELAALTPGPRPAGGEFGPLLPAERQVVDVARRARADGEDIGVPQAVMLLAVVERLTGGPDYTRRAGPAWPPPRPGAFPPGPPPDPAGNGDGRIGFGPAAVPPRSADDIAASIVADTLAGNPAGAPHTASRTVHCTRPGCGQDHSEASAERLNAGPRRGVPGESAPGSLPPAG